MSSSDNLVSQLSKPALAFAIGAGLMAWSHPGLLVEIMKSDVPAWALGGAAAAGLTIVGTAFNASASPHVTVITPLNAPIQTAANIALIAAGTALTYSLIVGSNWSEQISKYELIAGAAAIEVGSSYGAETWLKPYLASSGF